MSLNIGTNLATNLATILATSLAPATKARFADLTYANASTRLVDHGGKIITSFGANALTTMRYNGRLFVQIEEARENLQVRNHEYDDAAYTKVRCSVSADDINGPDGSATADKLVEDSSNNTHFMRIAGTPDGSSQYTRSMYVRPDERVFHRLNLHTEGFPSSSSYYNNSTGALGTSAGAPDALGIEGAYNSWYRSYIVGTSDAAAAGNYDTNFCAADNTPSYQGDGSSGLHIWNGQLEIGARPSSPIETGAVATTRAKDDAYWDSADVPTALRGKITFQIIPMEGTNVSRNRYLFNYSASGASTAYRYYITTTNRVLVYGVTETSTMVQTDALTFSRLQLLTITIDPVNCSITVSGATAGDGTYSDSNPWSTSEGAVYIGSNTANQFNGWISEPY